MIYKVTKTFKVLPELKKYVNAIFLKRGQFVELPYEVAKRWHRAACLIVSKDQKGAEKLIINPKKQEKKNVSKTKKKKMVSAK